TWAKFRNSRAVTSIATLALGLTPESGRGSRSRVGAVGDVMWERSQSEADAGPHLGRVDRGERCSCSFRHPTPHDTKNRLVEESRRAKPFARSVNLGTDSR